MDLALRNLEDMRGVGSHQHLNYGTDQGGPGTLHMKVSMTRTKKVEG